MTMIVVGITAVPVSLLIGSHIQGVLSSAEETTAQNLARLEMEKINNMSYAGIVSANFSNYEGYPYDLTRSVSFAAGDGASAESLKKISVDVRKTGSPAVIAAAVTYVAKNVGYGI